MVSCVNREKIISIALNVTDRWEVEIRFTPERIDRLANSLATNPDHYIR
jgi:hypothetical protein